jgi:hypothetical protein
LISELLGILVQIWNVIWPFQIVAQWEQGNYYVFGRYWKTVGPGLYPVVPWFFKIIDVSVARGIVGTGRQDITTADGGNSAALGARRQQGDQRRRRRQDDGAGALHECAVGETC